MWSRIKSWARLRHFEARDRPLAILESTIISNAAKCLESMKGHLYLSTESEKESAKIDLLLEFTWAFMHIASRYALGFLGPEKALSFIKDTLVPMTAWVSVETYFRDSPADVKEDAQAAFLRGAAARDIEYGQCRDLLIEGKAFSDDAVFSHLGKRVAEMAGSRYNPAIIMMVQCNIVRTLVDSRFNEVVKKAIKG